MFFFFCNTIINKHIKKNIAIFFLKTLSAASFCVRLGEWEAKQWNWV